ncbi:MAG: c-type cytochrome [Saprospiraceae bacterium]|nr:c-type cytochrome [Saprospiraceae bacterium]
MRTFYFLCSSLILLVGYYSCSSGNAQIQALSSSGNVDSLQMIERGEYLVATIGCDDCHSPKRMGPAGPEIIPELRLSGFQDQTKLPPIDISEVEKGWVLFAPDLTGAVGPWGISHAANLTSDDTGIGLWREENFIKAIREGKYKGLDGSRAILPPMPWQVYRNLDDTDLQAIFAYLKTVPAVRNVVPAPKLLSELP